MAVIVAVGVPVTAVDVALFCGTSVGFIMGVVVGVLVEVPVDIVLGVLVGVLVAVLTGSRVGVADDVGDAVGVHVGVDEGACVTVGAGVLVEVAGATVATALPPYNASRWALNPAPKLVGAPL